MYPAIYIVTRRRGGGGGGIIASGKGKGEPGREGMGWEGRKGRK